MDITSFSGEYRFLSNFYPCIVELDGEEYPSVEHAYQAAKTLDLNQRWAFQFTNVTAGLAKRMGRELVMRPDWEQVKIEVMRKLLEHKFCSDQSLFSQFLNTHPFYLVEGNNWGDTFWGVCNGKGKNHLGLLLMDIRQDLINHMSIPE